jgi:hypothetical protein
VNDPGWINVSSYNVVGKSNSFIQFSITETNGMTFDSAIIAYSCAEPPVINEVNNVDNVVKVYPNPIYYFFFGYLLVICL